MKLAGIEVGGFSSGGIRTCIDVPSYKLCFDLGALESFAVARPFVLFTHAHIDHMGAVASHCALRSLQGMSPPTYVVPHEQVEAFEELFRVWRRLDRSDLPHELVPLGPGEELELPGGRFALPFRSPHSAPCQGYRIVERKKKLLPELQGLPGEEIARRREAGEVIQAVVESSEVAFCGDTMIEVLDREPELYRVKVLILEATFLDERVNVQGAKSRGHVHLDEILDRAEKFENEAILLTHFSARYSSSDIRELVAKKLPSVLRDRVSVLVEPPRRGRA